MVGAAPHETPAGKSVEYVAPPKPVTTAPVPLASLRRVAGLVAGRKTKVPGMAVNGGKGGVKAALQRGRKSGESDSSNSPGPVDTHVYKAIPFTTRKSAM